MNSNKTMKIITMPSIAFILLLFATPVHAGLPQFLTSQERDWAFIQSVGGMKVSAKDSTLTVECDVSGLKTVTVKPTLINSGIGVRKLKHKRDGNTILLTLSTCVIGKGITTSPKPVDLSACPEGEYSVEYLDPNRARHPIGKIAIRRDADPKKQDNP
jgi:hypothetical protein